MPINPYEPPQIDHRHQHGGYSWFELDGFVLLLALLLALSLGVGLALLQTLPYIR